jgi:homoserine acetyltransferase
MGKVREKISTYKMMNNFKTIDITRNNESLESIISKVDANIYIVGINSDLFLLRRRIEIPTTKLENLK